MQEVEGEDERVLETCYTIYNDKYCTTKKLLVRQISGHVFSPKGGKRSYRELKECEQPCMPEAPSSTPSTI